MPLGSALPRDVAGVLESASLLEVSEYRVFEMAYRAWFGADAGGSASFDRCFFDYLYRDRVPPWVRTFTRGVVARGREADFDPAEYGVVHPPPQRTMIYLGCRYAIWAGAAVTAVIVAAHFAAEPFSCLFPPCY